MKLEDWRDVTTLAEARRGFLSKLSPWLIAAAIVVAAAVRLAIGDFGWADVIAVAAVLVIYPFGEWAIHVYVLHMRPLEVGGRTIDPSAAKGHREHHSRPNDLTLINLEPSEVAQLLFLSVPVVVGVMAGILTLVGVDVPIGAAVTAVLADYCLVMLYEWTHFLIHTAYQPKTRWYRAAWRNHRLHHFKNEHFWQGITSTIADRALGTLPDQRDVERSSTARALDQRPAG